MQRYSSSLETELWSNITDMDVLERLMSLQIADLDDKWVWAVALAVDDELSHNGGIVCGLSKSTDPPLGSSEIWRVQSEGLVIRIPCCGGFKTSNI